MEIVLVIVIVAVGLMLLRPEPRQQVIYMPMRTDEGRGGGMGCLPLLVTALLIVVLLTAIGY